MGFINYIVNVVVQILPFSGNNGGLLNQQPLPINVPSSGVSFSPQLGNGGVGNVPQRESQITCHYPSLKGWEMCNGPDSRNCWLRETHSKQPVFSEYDITTDYEAKWPQGVTREYWLEVSEKTISPDGTPKLSQLINGTYPGPLIEACWGDDIVVHVTDKLVENGTTIHWHGVRQLHTNDADGVNGITQCPIAGNRTYTYKFKATQYGHSWYHSHYSLQYPNGVAGPLLIHGPTSANWDVELDPIMMADWFNANAFAAFHTELGPKPPPLSNAVLLGGIGIHSGSIFTRVVESGKKVLLHLINASTDMHFVFSIDDHPLQVITTDFVPIEPYWTNSISIGIGQRYSVIVDANQTAGNYWMRTTPVLNCSGNKTHVDNRTGILRYQGAPNTKPTTSIQSGLTFACQDEPPEKLKPVVRWEVGTNPANNVIDSTYEVGTVFSRNATRWAIGAKSLWLDFADPTLLDVNNRTFNPDYDVEKYDFDNEWIYIIITASGNITGVPTPPNRGLVPLAHPIHLHGHDFAVLGAGNGTYNEKSDPFTFEYHNPPRRDVALLPSEGWLALAFRSDNPGVWLLHCHIAWHASSGLALQILERTGDIHKALGPERLDAVKETCKQWKQWDATERVNQEDSGI
ncbi:CAZyme family AA1 [Paecilomyces variotii]|nr:CAZyme family AA1 [Paecilomyces variotii]